MDYDSVLYLFRHTRRQVSRLDEKYTIPAVRRRTGIMAMIEEEIYVPRGTDNTLLEKLHRGCVKSAFYDVPKQSKRDKVNVRPDEAFVINWDSKYSRGPCIGAPKFSLG